MRNANDALNSLSARLKGEVDSITAQIEAGNEFEIYIKALSLLTDIEHLRKNIGLEFEGYDNFRGFVDSTEKKVIKFVQSRAFINIYRLPATLYTQLYRQLSMPF